MGYRLNYSFQHLVPKGPYRLETGHYRLHYRSYTTHSHITPGLQTGNRLCTTTETHASGTSAYYRRPGVILLQLARSNGSRPKTTDDKPGTDYVLLPDYTYHRFLYYKLWYVLQTTYPVLDPDLMPLHCSSVRKDILERRWLSLYQ
jgi:hypothetical protein